MFAWLFGQATLSVNYVCMAFWTGYSQCELCVKAFWTGYSRSRCELCVHGFFYVCMAFLCVHGFFEQARYIHDI